MIIHVYLNESSDNTINKKLVESFHTDLKTKPKNLGNSMIQVLISNTNLSNPRIVHKSNYCYIEELERYYFITDIKLLNNGIAEITAKLDILESFKKIILDSTAIIDSAEAYQSNYYLSSDSWVKTCRDKTDVISFNNGLLDNGEFILVTAGG